MEVHTQEFFYTVFGTHVRDKAGMLMVAGRPLMSRVQTASFASYSLHGLSPLVKDLFFVSYLSLGPVTLKLSIQDL